MVAQAFRFNEQQHLSIPRQEDMFRTGFHGMRSALGIKGAEVHRVQDDSNSITRALRPNDLDDPAVEATSQRLRTACGPRVWVDPHMITGRSQNRLSEPGERTFTIREA